MPVRVSSDVVARLLAEAERVHPLECCGILLGDGEAVAAILPAGNVHPQPDRHFEIDPQALIDAHRGARSGGPQVLGYYHSHPNGLPRPSATDRSLAAPDGAIWAIIAAGRITLWRSGDAGFAALPYEVAPR
ncbi:M67 family metallopeptidase [Qipengyuania sp.]|uniref:M67 family metallopeptidase n=1 Tax=Qipengyuania sp. TaxID=2004515 RepID=UPI003AF5D804